MRRDARRPSPSGPRMAMPSARPDPAVRAVGRHEVAGADGARARRSATSRSTTVDAVGAGRSTPTTSVPSCDARAAQRRAGARSSTGSRWSCGTQAGAVGLTSGGLLARRDARGHRTTRSAAASPASPHCQPCHSTSTPPARIASSTPQERISSIERVLTDGRARQRTTARPGARRAASRRRAGASVIAAASPAGPAPDDQHRDARRSCVGHVVISSDSMSFSRQHVKRISHADDGHTALRAASARARRPRRRAGAILDARRTSSCARRRPSRSASSAIARTGRGRAIDRLRGLRLARRALRRVRRRPARARRASSRVRRRRRRPRPARAPQRRRSPAASQIFAAAPRRLPRARTRMAELDPEAVGGAMQRSEQRRASGMARLARRLAEHGLLREGVEREAGRATGSGCSPASTPSTCSTAGAACRRTRWPACSSRWPSAACC